MGEDMLSILQKWANSHTKEIRSNDLLALCWKTDILNSHIEMNNGMINPRLTWSHAMCFLQLFPLAFPILAFI